MNNLNNDIVMHVKTGNCDYLQFRKLLELGVKHAYGLKPLDFGVSNMTINSEQYMSSMENYKKLCDYINVDYKRLVRPIQKHTATVLSINKDVKLDINDFPIVCNKILDNTDGVITNEKNIILATTNADCILFVLYDPVKKVIANIHSGWRGTFQKISVNAVNKMVADFGCNVKDIMCFICPSIRKCHFEVEEDVKTLCEKTFSNMEQIDEIITYVGKVDNVEKWCIDTVLITKILLKNIGIAEENIIDCNICSVCSNKMVHSRRADGKDFRLGSLIVSL